jgi:hypothetical protein
MKKGIIEASLYAIEMDPLSDYIINWNFDLPLSSEHFALFLTTEAKDFVDLCHCGWALDHNMNRHLRENLGSYACCRTIGTVN